jgi:hypothetical protein
VGAAVTTTWDDLRPPRALSGAEKFDDDIRAVVLELLDACVWSDANIGYYEMLVAAVLAHPRASELVDCLARMATGGLSEHYYGDDEWTSTVIVHELDLCEELKNVAADDLADPEDPAAPI